MMKQGKAPIMHMTPALLAALFASACAVSTPAIITSARSSTQPIAEIQLLNESSAASLRGRFHEELTGKFAERGISFAPNADFVADFAVSQRKADVGLQAVSDSETATQPNKPNFRSHWYHKCKPARVSASLVIYARSSGAVQAKSSGEFLACPDDLSQLDQLAGLLVDRALAN
ncbi:MAG: hypothetical protein ABJK59_06210 [Erythrobacter sp.]|uniref:hypothetical protein n=1 Tax=Erythrobacter sp. TaxID=1042 RepID=UPI0032996723